MTWDPDPVAKAAAMNWGRERRKFWAAHDRDHPAPGRTAAPGRWITPAWTGPQSPQCPVWIED